MSARASLYSPAILAAAVSLADFPPNAALPLHGEARSRSCGSALELQLRTDDAGGIVALGCRAHACAVGQAAAAVFARGARGRGRPDIAAARQALALWLSGGPVVPDWPEIDLLAPARAYPARHAAILLAWDAALTALGRGALAQASAAG